MDRIDYFKQGWLFLLAMALLFTACTPSPSDEPPTSVAVETSLPIATKTITPPPSATATTLATITPTEPVATPTATSTVTTITTAVTPLSLTLPPVPPTYTPAQRANVFFQVGADHYRWDETTNSVTLINQPPPDLSVDESLAYQLSPDGTKFAVVVSTAPESYRLLVRSVETDELLFEHTFTANATLSRYEWATGVLPQLLWANNQRLLWHLVPTADGIGEPTLDDVHLLNLEEGSSTLLLPASTAYAFRLFGNGRYLLAAETGVLHLADLETAVVVSHPLPIRNSYDAIGMFLSPDEHTLFIAGETGLLLIDLTSQTSRTVDIYYPSIGMSHFSIYPNAYWSENGQSLYLLIPAHPQQPHHIGDNYIFEPDAEIGLWRLDLETATAVDLLTFPGFYIDTTLNPTATHLITTQRVGTLPHYQIELIDIATRETTVIAEVEQFRPWRWSVNGRFFAYDSPNENTLIFISTNGEQTRFSLTQPLNDMRWLDDDRFLAVTCDSSYEQCALTLRRRTDPQFEQVLFQTDEGYTIITEISN